MCKLKKPIYGFKHASWQWYIKFNDTIILYDLRKTLLIVAFTKSRKYQWEQVHIVSSICWWYIFAFNDLEILHETNDFLSKNFEKNDIGEESYVIGIEIFLW